MSYPAIQLALSMLWHCPKEPGYSYQMFFFVSVVQCTPNRWHARLCNSSLGIQQTFIMYCCAFSVQSVHRTFPTFHTLLMQRHRVRIIPVSEVRSIWKTKEFTYFVYGDNRLVYTDSYPQTCCWGCTVL